MKRLLYITFVVLLVASCSEKDDTLDPYDNWAERNAAWYEQVADSARTAIRQAQQQYGQQWQEHCPWRMYQSTTLQPDLKGPVTDSICLRYINRSTATASPLWTDSVRVNYRGYLMPSVHRIAGRDTLLAKVFDQSYYGSYNPLTAYPQQLLVSGTVPGFATALQHMHQGDEVMIYIPHQLGYGKKEHNTVPAYSTMRFHLSLVEFFRSGDGTPGWK